MKKSFEAPTFIPTSIEEAHHIGWSGFDVIIVSGDCYYDSPFVGAAVIGRVLLEAGYRVGIIPQPDVRDGKDILRLGEPELFWGVTAGSVDSMVANYTSLGKKRKSDDMTPGGKNERRPDRAVIVYANLIRRFFKNTRPIILGGVEASLRRLSHYDVWTDSIRRSILFDAKADIIVYGMGERAILEIGRALSEAKSIKSIRGICYVSKHIPENSPMSGHPPVKLADHAVVTKNKKEFIRMFRTFYENADPVKGKILYQRQDARFIVQNPPQLPLSAQELDKIYEMPFTRMLHPRHKTEGKVSAVETIGFSLTTHRGCFGECRFCAISVHQGKHVVSRRKASVLREAAAFTRHPDFKGVISDVGGPTANMYGIDCKRKKTKGACIGKSCLFPKVCNDLPVDHTRQIELLRSLSRLKGVRKVFVASGLRYDLIMKDKKYGGAYLENLIRKHISGQLKIAPEHVQDSVLRLMGKPGRSVLEKFLHLFKKLNAKNGGKVFLTYYLMAAHPGCTLSDMRKLRSFAAGTLKLLPEQIQIFTPTPSTFSSLMYYTNTDPFSGEKIFVEKNTAAKKKQKLEIKKKRKKTSAVKLRPQKDD